jgi:hypothetical protein
MRSFAQRVLQILTVGQRLMQSTFGIPGKGRGLDMLLRWQVRPNVMASHMHMNSISKMFRSITPNLVAVQRGDAQVCLKAVIAPLFE